MEMTPVTQRDVTVQAGDGAKPQGRDTSSSSTEETTTKKAASDLEARETPFDPLAEALAGRLRMADPKMDTKMAMTLAKSMLAGHHTYDVKAHADTSKGDVNVTA